MKKIKYPENEKLFTLKDFSDTEQSAIVDYITSAKQNWDSSLSERKEAIIDNRKAWYGNIGGYDIDQQLLNEDSDLELPLMYSMVESITAQEISVIFPAGDDFFTMQPQSQNDVDMTERAKRLMLYIVKQMDFRNKMIPIFRTCNRDGLACAKVIWEVEQQPIRERIEEPIFGDNKYTADGRPIYARDKDGNPIIDAMTGQPIFEKELVGYEEYFIERQAKMKDMANIFNIDVLNLSFNPLTRSFDDADVIERYFATYDFLMSQEDYYENLDQLEDLETETMRNDTNSPLTSVKAGGRNFLDGSTDDLVLSRTMDGGVDTTSVQTLSNIEMWDFYGDISIIRDDGSSLRLKNYQATIADNGRVLVNCEPCNYTLGDMVKKHPYIMMGCVKDSDYIAKSRSIADVAIVSQQHLNTLVRAVVASAERDRVGKWQAQEGEVDQEVFDVLESGDNCIVEVPFFDAVRPLQQPSSNLQLLDFAIKFLKGEAQESTGATSIFMGAQDKSRRTAKEQSIRADAMSAKMKMLIVSKECFLNEVMARLFDLAKICIEDSVWIRLNEDNAPTFEEIKMYELEKNSYDFAVYTVTDSINRSETIDKWMQFIEIAGRMGIQYNQNEVLGIIANALKVPASRIVYDQPMMPTGEAQQDMQQFATMITGGNPEQANQVLQQYYQIKAQQQQQQQPQQGANNGQ